MNKQTFLHGTLILVGAGFVTKVLGFVYRIALSRIIGDEGMGLFQMAFPILIFAIGMTTAGLPVAISKLISEAEAKGKETGVRSILLVSILIVTCTSILFTGLMIFLAPIIAQTLLTDERAIYPLMGIAPIIPIVAVSSIFRGYFQGRQNMQPYAIAQIIEQSVRIFTVLLLAIYLLPLGIEYAAAGAMIGMVIGEGASLYFLLRSYRRDPRRPILRTGDGIQGFGTSLRRLLRIAVPVTASRIVGSLTYAIEPIVVAQSLAIAGIATQASTALYGQLEGMAIPLVFFPAFITYALSVTLVPAISEAAAQNKQRLVEHRLGQAIRLSFILGGPCATIMFVLAEPLSLLLYNHIEVARIIKIMAPFAIFLYLQGPLAAVLQGLDQAGEAMRNSIFGSILKIILIFILGSLPHLGIDGVALAMNCGIVIVTVLHFLSLTRYLPFTFNGRNIIKWIIATGTMGITAYWISSYQGLPLLQQVILATFTSGAVYLILILLLALIRKEDVSRIPYIGRWFAYFLPQ